MNIDKNYIARNTFNTTMGVEVDAPASPMSELQMAVKHLHAVEDRMRDVSDRLAGGVPREDARGIAAAGSVGLFGQISTVAAEINGIVSAIEADLSRITDRL